MEQVLPAAPVAPWLGGKKALHRQIIEMIARVPHRCYAEPFVGMGGVFLRRPFRPRIEVANDLNGEIVNLFRILQRHYTPFLDMMRYQITSRAEFERLRRVDPATLTDLERAARFLYLQRVAFGGKLNGVFGVSSANPAQFDISRLGPILEAAHSRLSGVTFEALPWADLLRRYDGPDTLFYLDPPYWGGENDYGKGMFARSEFEEMAECLAHIRGRFILSINDRPEIRALFGRFTLREVRLSYSVSSSGATDAAELLVSDQPIATDLFSRT